MKKDYILSGHRNTLERICCGKNCKNPHNGRFRIIFFKFGMAFIVPHGEKVSNLIASPYPSATIPSNKHFDYIGFDNLNQKSKFYDSFMRCQEENSCPSYTNISMDIFSLSKEGFNVFDLIDRANIVTVTSAGNDERFMNSIKREYARNQDLIAVGNCGINGNPYHNSNYAPEVTVCAPADHNILRSYDFAGRIVEFGGTSGAAPQVTAALAAFTAITGYYLKPQESIEILKKTAIPHPHLPTQSNMGAGMLNTWKIGEVAFKLRKRCQENKTCYADSLQSEDTFKFYVDKPSLIKWTSDMEKEGGSREEKENLLKDLRKAALLNSFDEQLWGLLASVNRKRCLEEQAQYYQSLANRAKKTDQELLYELEKTGQYSMLKYLYFSHEEMKEDLTELYFSMLEKEEDIDREALIDLSKALISNEVATSPRQKELWEMLINHSKIDGVGLWILGTEIAFSAENISDHEKLLQMIINHSKISGATLGLVGEIIAHNAENISGHEKLLQMIISHSKINGAVLGEVGRGIAHYSKNIPSYESFLQKIISHPKNSWNRIRGSQQRNRPKCRRHSRP